MRADFLIHAIGVPGAILASAFLIFAAITHGGAGKVAAIIVYASGMVAMFTASAAYNLNYESRWRGVFRRCDHAAIFLMIAGTCTPFTTQIHSGQATIWFTAIIWMFSLLGVVLKIFVAERIERYSDWVYLGLGWAAVVVLTPLIANLNVISLVAAAIGGALYSIGVIFHRWDNLRYNNAIWHAFVLCASAAFYVAILEGVVLTPA